ncbi:response regulator [Leptothoe sp. PORK10 BA2]|uniref:response regulator n=1 Tax=Leptothoe sp. PORK10 BA2 TaxID=3110254 RepID=UPI002B215244|nr:response regulator [Leptothoe sp. PORK10 BA2]MEA5462520.1 response regulator [Leptothoe sp. PORK10 BA2]
MLQFESEQLGDLILQLQNEHFCGVASIETLSNVSTIKHPRILVFLDGEITYGGLSLPNPIELSKELGQHLKLDIMEAALQLAQKKVDDPTSVRKYLELFILLKLFDWKDVESYMRTQTTLVLEQIYPYAGRLTLKPSSTVYIAYGEDRHGFTWEQLQDDIVQRIQAWAELNPIIPSAHSIPYQLKTGQKVITDVWAQQHLPQWVNGQRTLDEIANQINIDPLELAKKYLGFVQNGWLTFEQDLFLSTTNKLEKKEETPKVSTVAPQDVSRQLPTILSVDDSPVVQAMIKRIVGDHYHLLLASNAMDALSLLNQAKIELLLLDVTMPDIDGLELCRTIRGINRFRDLPIIMLTAKDGVFSKIRGQIAGSTHYLTKPVERSKLLEILGKYIPSKVMS